MFTKNILKKKNVDLVVNIIKEKLPIEESLRKKIELICEFAKTTPKIINGNIRKIDRTNLTYIETNRIIIKDKTFLIFNYSNEVFIENLTNKIKTVTENNEALNLRVKTLNNTIKEKDNEISFLKFKIKGMQNTLEYWKDKFNKLVFFLHSKLHSWYDKDDKYIDVVNDMYEDNVLNDEDIKELDLSKEKDDFER